jgi:Na+-translocating ferredoxin:NAD+ oxidoreductase RnfC subunit
VVSPGQQVFVGDLIGQIPQDALGANVHASIAGRISKVVDGKTVEIEA